MILVCPPTLRGLEFPQVQERAGEVALLVAAWDDSVGYSVKLRLIGINELRAHPFKIYQKRRRGRVVVE
mgnify:CR=1 FL=1